MNDREREWREIAVVPMGFGCAYLHSGRSRSQSIALVEAAFDAGLRYFDVARLYGEGAAEGVVGTVLSGVRDRIVLASKAGILPTDRSIPRRLAERGLRALRRIPGVGGRLPLLPPAEPRFHLFDAPTMRRSVETSLAQLKTSHLDILLLHECTLLDLTAHEVTKTLDRFRSEGKIGKIGLATGVADTIEILADHDVDVVQIASSAVRPDVERLPTDAASLVVTHSMLRAVLPIVERVSDDPVLRDEWKSRLSFDPRDRAALSAMAIAHARHTNPEGLMLFSSSNVANIRFNVDACRKPWFDGTHVETFADYVQELAGR